jgi:hypothetical protein
MTGSERMAKHRAARRAARAADRAAASAPTTYEELRILTVDELLGWPPDFRHTPGL